LIAFVIYVSLLVVRQAYFSREPSHTTTSSSQPDLRHYQLLDLPVCHHDVQDPPLRRAVRRVRLGHPVHQLATINRSRPDIHIHLDNDRCEHSSDDPPPARRAQQPPNRWNYHLRWHWRLILLDRTNNLSARRRLCLPDRPRLRDQLLRPDQLHWRHR